MAHHNSFAFQSGISFDAKYITLAFVAGVGHAPAPLAFAGFDNPASGDFHPNFDRSPTAIAKTEASGKSHHAHGIRQ